MSKFVAIILAGVLVVFIALFGVQIAQNIRGTNAQSGTPTTSLNLTSNPAISKDPSSNGWVMTLNIGESFIVSGTLPLTWTVNWSSTPITAQSVGLPSGFKTAGTYRVSVTDGTTVEQIRIEVSDIAGRSGNPATATSAPTTTPTNIPTATPAPTNTATPTATIAPYSGTVVAGADYFAEGVEDLPDGWSRLQEATNKNYCAWSAQWKLELIGDIKAQWPHCMELRLIGTGTAKFTVKPDSVGYATSDTTGFGLAWWPSGVGEYSVLLDPATNEWTGWQALSTGPEGVDFPLKGGERRMEFKLNNGFVTIPLGEVRKGTDNVLIVPKY